MSYPPRPPIGMPPGMPPGMMPQGYGFHPPMGMMPMGMGMMPMMRPGGQMNSGPPQNKPKKLIPQEIPSSEKKEEKPPVTTVFVGNISERAPDAMVRQMLQRCGNVLSWKRVQGASGKLQAFGFCEYEDPEATLRCIRLLNEWNIIDRKLVVKVDAKTRTLLDDYKRKKKEKEKGPAQINKDKNEEDGDKEEGEADDETSTLNDPLDEFTMREDRVAKAGLDAIMREYAEDLNKEPPPGKGADREKKERKKLKEKEPVRDDGIDDMNIEDEKKDLISREIRSFRDAHKGEDDREREREKERELRRRRDEERERERDRERQRRERERERKVKERQLKERSRSRSRSRERTPSRESRERERERDREREMREQEDEEEMYERRKLERKMREKEAAYQEMLKKWESRERKKAREYEKEKEREEDRKSEESREGRRLKEFLEDYNDDRDDPKYYKGSALQRRLKEREKEMEIDERDRQREKEELEAIRRQLIEEGHPDPEAEMARIERERDEHLMPRLHEQPEEEEIEEIEEEPQQQQQSMSQDEEDQGQQAAEITQYHQQQNGIRSQQLGNSQRGGDVGSQPVVAHYASSQDSPSDNDSPGMGMMASEDSQSQSQSYQGIGPSQEDHRDANLGFSDLKLGQSDSPQEHSGGRRKKMTVGDVFNQDEENVQGPRRRKLVPIVYSDDEKAAISSSKPTTAEEKRKCIKNLIERIPTAKEELFGYRLDWTMVDMNLMERRIKPWINKKIVEYIGEEEPTLTDFICQKVMGNSMPQMILDDVAMVLDEEAEVFVVKMWRLLIYETEAKKLGLVK